MSEFVTITKDNHQERKTKETERRKKANAVSFMKEDLAMAAILPAKLETFQLGQTIRVVSLFYDFTTLAKMAHFISLTTF